MKITLTKEQLLSGIQTVQNIVSSKATLPILSNMLIETKNNAIKINTTDLDIGISCEIPVNIIEEGGITIPAKRFSDIVRELPSGNVTVSTKKNNQIEIEGENCRFKLTGLPKEEFPKFPDFKDRQVIEIEQSILKEMLKLTSFAVSHEESRYVLNGVLIEISENNMRIVSTDGKRLAKIDNKITKSINEEISIIIPFKAVAEIMRNLKETGNVLIYPGTNQILFDINGVLIVTRIIEGDFPNYHQVIPPEASKKVKIKTQEFLSAIRRANLLSTPDFQAVKFEVFNDKLVVSKTTPDIGESREEVKVSYGGDELIVGFNPNFFIDALKSINNEEIPLELMGADKPGVIRLDSYVYLVLPMRT